MRLRELKSCSVERAAVFRGFYIIHLATQGSAIVNFSPKSKRDAEVLPFPRCLQYHKAFHAPIAPGQLFPQPSPGGIVDHGGRTVVGVWKVGDKR